jgi:hypothetical protein
MLGYPPLVAATTTAGGIAWHTGRSCDWRAAESGRRAICLIRGRSPRHPLFPSPKSGEQAPLVCAAGSIGAGSAEHPAEIGGIMRMYRSAVRFLVGVVCAFVVPLSASAAPILNGSFEQGAFADTGAPNDGTMSLPAGSTTIDNWTVTTDTIAWIVSPNIWGLAAQDGNLFLDLTNLEAGAPFGGVTQTIATTPGDNYILSFYLGSYTARWGGPPSILATAGTASQTCTNPTPTTQSTWTLCTVPFTAVSSMTAITLAGTTGFNYIGLDNVSVTPAAAPVPEPSSILLLGAAAAGLLARARRRLPGTL